MTETILYCRSIQELEQTAGMLLANSTHKVFAFYGELGAGKTTLIRAICKQLGVEEEISSPTYNIVNEYIAGEQKVFHFDLYRVKDAEELFDIGFEEYLSSGNICLIEWPEIAENLLPHGKINTIRISREEWSEARRISVAD
jgi:tRNA threonylcarbamoyladenosine biosynthesis protein TsaE